MASGREYGAAIFSPGLADVLLIKHNDEEGWAFPFTSTTESDVHVVAAASAVRQILGVDIGDKIERTHWIEVEYPRSGALVRLYVALGVRPDSVAPHCAPGASAQWHPLRSILPPVNAILRADNAAAAAGSNGNAAASDEEEGGELMLEPGIAPFIAKLKALLNKHPEWRISQLDPHLTRLIVQAITLPPQLQQQQLQPQPQQQLQPQQQEQQLLPQGQQGAGHEAQAAGQQQPQSHALPQAQPQPQEERQQEGEEVRQEPPSPSPSPSPSPGPVPGPDALAAPPQPDPQQPPPQSPHQVAAAEGAVPGAAVPPSALLAGVVIKEEQSEDAGGAGAPGPVGPLPEAMDAALGEQQGQQEQVQEEEEQAGAQQAEQQQEEQRQQEGGEGLQASRGEEVPVGGEGEGGHGDAAAAAAAETGTEAETTGLVAEAEAGVNGCGEVAAAEVGAGGVAEAGAAAEGDAGGGGEGVAADGCEGGGWRGPRPQEHLLEWCRINQFPDPCYSLVVKKFARRPLVTASCILPHLGVQITPDMHVPGGMAAACMAAALAAILWLEGALPADGGEVVRVVPVGWPPLLSEARGESWEAAQRARRAGARREMDTAQREALLREMDKKRQRLVAEAAELERLMAALRGGDSVSEPDLSRLTASLGLGPSLTAPAAAGGGSGAEAEAGEAATTVAVDAGAAAAAAGPGPWAGAGGSAAGAGEGLAGPVTVGMRALQFRSSSGSGTGAGQGGGGGGGRGGGGGGGRAPGTKRPREDGHTPWGGSAGAAGGQQPDTPKNVVMELKELCDRRRWPQPFYSYSAAGSGHSAGGTAAVLAMPPATGLGEVSSGPQSNRKRAKEAAAAAALAKLSALGIK